MTVKYASHLNPGDVVTDWENPLTVRQATLSVSPSSIPDWKIYYVLVEFEDGTIESLMPDTQVHVQ